MDYLHYMLFCKMYNSLSVTHKCLKLHEKCRVLVPQILKARMFGLLIGYGMMCEKVTKNILR